MSWCHVFVVVCWILVTILRNLVVLLFLLFLTLVLADSDAAEEDAEPEHKATPSLTVLTLSLAIGWLVFRTT